jgi:hypothetical protein
VISPALLLAAFVSAVPCRASWTWTTLLDLPGPVRGVALGRLEGRETVVLARGRRLLLVNWSPDLTVKTREAAVELPGDPDDAAADVAGIGVAGGSSDLFMVRTVVPGGAVAAEGSIRPGDVISAVSGPDGRFVETKGLSSFDINRLTHGKPGTTVRLRVERLPDISWTVTVRRRLLPRASAAPVPRFAFSSYPDMRREDIAIMDGGADGAGRLYLAWTGGVLEASPRGSGWWPSRLIPAAEFRADRELRARLEYRPRLAAAVASVFGTGPGVEETTALLDGMGGRGPKTLFVGTRHGELKEYDPDTGRAIPFGRVPGSVVWLWKGDLRGKGYPHLYALSYDVHTQSSHLTEFTYRPEPLTVAVADFAMKRAGAAAASVSGGRVLADFTKTSLRLHGVQEVEPRGRAEVAAEREFQTSQCEDGACAKRLGQVLHANALVRGRVEVSGDRYAVSLEAVDTLTGRAVVSERGVVGDMDRMQALLSSFARRFALEWPR